MRPHSLQWRLPLLFVGLVTLVLATFLGVMRHEVRHAMLHAGGERAKGSADQLAALLAPGLRQRHAEFRRVAADPGLREYVQAPTAAGRIVIEARLAALQTSGAQVLEIWSGSERRLLLITHGKDDAAALGSNERFPAAMEMTSRGERPISVITEPIPSPDPSAAPSGYLVIRRYISASPTPDVLSRLVGGDARVMLGARDAKSWTDLQSVVPAPPLSRLQNASLEYRSAGIPVVASSSEISGTPWIVWVELPASVALAPAQAFLKEMFWITGAFVLIAGVVAWLMTKRLTRPLVALATASEAIAAGDYSHQVDESYTGEIGRLASSFNAMVREVRRAHVGLADRIAERSSALTALEASEARHRETVEVLRKSDERIQFALEAARAGVWEADLATGRITWSDTMRLVHGLAPAQFGGTMPDLIALFHPDDRQTMADRMLRHVTDASDFEFEARVIWPNGEVHWMLARGRVQVDQEGRPARVLGVAQDVTLHKQLETQLRQAQKMEAIGQLAGGIAHDFNNMLTAVLGFAVLLEEENVPDDQRRQDAGEIRLAAERAAALTKQLLAFSRQQVLEPRVVLLSDTLQDMAPMLRRVIGEHIEIVIDSNDVPPVLADPSQLEQVVLNLAVNAADAMPKGGRLLLRTSETTFTHDYIATHPEARLGRHAVLEVSDTGAGMDAATQARVFEPFFTTKELGRGTGLGLSTVHGVVTQMSGSIIVYSELGYGTTFKVYFPETTAASLDRPVPAASTTPIRGSETILLVEDEPAVRHLADTALRRQGYDVLATGTPAEALNAMHESTRHFDLVISDVIMPGGVGPELVAKLREQRPDLTALYMSGYSGASLTGMANFDASSHFIQKPFTANALLSKVRQVLDADH